MFFQSVYLLSWLFFSCPAKIRVIALFSGTPVASRSVTDTSSSTCLDHPASHCSCKEKHCNTTTTGNSSEARSTKSHYSISEFEIATTLCHWNTSSVQCNGIWFCSPVCATPVYTRELGYCRGFLLKWPLLLSNTPRGFSNDYPKISHVVGLLNDQALRRAESYLISRSNESST